MTGDVHTGEIERQLRLADSEQVETSPRPSQDTTRSTAEPSSSMTAPLEAYHAALERMVEMARCAGASEERTRINEIMSCDSARRFPRLAWSLAKTGAMTLEQAVEALALAEADLTAMAWQSSARH